ncbi:MAG: P27 family phage terminase small subunit, partial [Bacteroidales bacterium]
LIFTHAKLEIFKNKIMKGRPRLSKEEKLKRGTYAPSRDIEEAVFENLERVPRAPRYMNTHSREIYYHVSADLHENGLLTNSNYRVMCGYATEMGKYIEAEEKLSKMKSRTIELTNKDGDVYNIIRHPLDKMASEYYNNALRYAVQLGITPASVNKVPVKKTKEDDNPFLKIAKL